MNLVINIFAILLGYFLGSISPAYFLTKAIKKKDIRKIGEKNAGATNVFRKVGFWPGVITVVYDLLKGVLSILIAKWIGAGELFIYFAGIFAIIGHIFPFYLNFKGGQGAATTVGLLLFFLAELLLGNFLPLESLGILLIVTVLIYTITHQKDFLSLIIMPSLIFSILKNYNFNYLVLFTCVVCAYLFSLSIYNSYRKKLFVLKEKTKENILVWRTLARPLAFAFVIAYFYLDKSIILWVSGILTLIPLTLDLLRLASNKLNFYFFDQAKIIFKKRERKRFSSITLFLGSIFLVVYFFDKYIAMIAISYLIFGDMFAKFFGLEYGKTKIFGDKTLEGSLAHFTACLLVGYLLWPYTDLSFWLIFAAAIIATIFEALPIGINDNFSVSVTTALFMSFTKKWF